MATDVQAALRSLRRARRQLAIEAVLAAGFVSALPFLAERFTEARFVRVDAVGALPEIQALYLLLLAGFVVVTVRLAKRLIAVLGTPCPGCGEAFHGDGQLLWVRDIARSGCAHCGIALAQPRGHSHRPV